MPFARVDPAPPTRAVPLLARPYRRLRAALGVAVVSVDKPKTPIPLSRPGACVAVHRPDRTDPLRQCHALRCRTLGVGDRHPSDPTRLGANGMTRSVPVRAPTGSGLVVRSARAVDGLLVPRIGTDSQGRRPARRSFVPPCGPWTLDVRYGAAMQRFPLVVSRYVVREGGSILLDADGLLMTTGLFGGPAGDLLPLGSLVAASLCILGEPGAGKSTALKVLAQSNTWDSVARGAPKIVEVGLAEVTDRTAFRELITEPLLHSLQCPHADRIAVTLVLDGLDECPLPNSKVLASWLEGALVSVDSSALRVLLACRTTDYPDLINDSLKRLLPHFEVFELAPLSGEDVSKLATSRGLDGPAFLEAVVASGSGPLASLPLTLDLLVRRYQRDGRLSGPSSALYEDGLLALADEPDPARDPQRRLLGSPEQRLVVASRLCCYLLLCGRAAFWTGEPGASPPGDLDARNLAGGEEKQTGGTFTVTAELAESALHTALFTSRGRWRLGPGHATFGAYLAARHLASRQLPEAQLRALLIARTEAGSLGIIPVLRETAAWLVALRPNETGWLAEVEPNSLVAHAALIEDDAVRALIVDRLLDDPGPALAGSWLHRWRLGHPGLAAQLLSVLSLLADPSATMPTLEQAYLALLLAEENKPPQLQQTLLTIVARTDLDGFLRAKAATCAAALDRDGSAPTLREILIEISAEPAHDPDDELRGALLLSLWPEHLAVEELLRALTKRQRPEFYGLYAGFCYQLPDLLRDGDLTEILSWVISGTSLTDPQIGPNGQINDSPHRDAELAIRLVERALQCTNAQTVLEPIADVICLLLQSHHDVALPERLDQRDHYGNEPVDARGLRRELALAVLDRLPEGRVHLVIASWRPSDASLRRLSAPTGGESETTAAIRTSLLDKADVPWLIELALGSETTDQAKFSRVLRVLFDPLDPDSREAATTTEGTVLWPVFARWFDAVPLGGPEEAEERERWTDTRPHEPLVRPEEAEHANTVISLYTERNDPDAFWQLVYRLQYDPHTLQGCDLSSDDLTTYPGVTLLPDTWLEPLLDASWSYLHGMSARGRDFIDNPRLRDDWMWAGYCALALIARHGQSGHDLDALEDAVLANWAPAVVVPGWLPSNQGAVELKDYLLLRLKGLSQTDLPDLVSRMLRGHLSSESLPIQLDRLDAGYSAEVGHVVARHLQGVVSTIEPTMSSDAAPAAEVSTGTAEGEPTHSTALPEPTLLLDTVSITVGYLARNADDPGIELALDLIKLACRDAASVSSLAIAERAATALLRGQGALWARVISRLRDCPGLMRAVLMRLSVEWGRGPRLLQMLSDGELAELWELLVDLWPYEEDVFIGGAHTVTPDEHARNWRNAVLDTLASRGTPDASRLLKELSSKHPSLNWLAGRVRSAEERERQEQWVPLSPEQLTALLGDGRARLVRSDSDLSSVILEAFEAAQRHLARVGHLLWNSSRVEGVERWRPKSEPDFGAWISEELTRDLAEHGVIINRGVLVQQTSASSGLGLSVDVQADAPGAIDEYGRQLKPVRVRIEIKGNWNAELLSAMETQLLDDYMAPEGLRDAVYLTAWFDVAVWDDTTDRRRSVAQGRDRAEVATALTAQAQALSRRGFRIQSVILDVTRAVPNARRRRTRQPSSGT